MMEAVEGYNRFTRRNYKSLCRLRREPLAIERVVYRDKLGRLVIYYMGNWIEVYKDGGRYYEKKETDK